MTMENTTNQKHSRHEKNFRNALILALSNLEETPTPQKVRETAITLAPVFQITGNLDAIVADALTAIQTRMGAGASLIDKKAGHDRDWVQRRKDIKWTYSDAYNEFLEGNGWAEVMVHSLDTVTGNILGLLQDPKSEGSWSRRGLVIGHVQSGKTANYTGLIAKAADAGYKFIVVIAGIHNNLRKQTQERIEEAFIGRSSDEETFTVNPNDENNGQKIGVGTNAEYPHPMTFTTVHDDFDKNTANKVRAKINDFRNPIVLVIKKNASTLLALYSWLCKFNIEGTDRISDVPMLMIDDEADNASINTNKADASPKVSKEQSKKANTDTNLTSINAEIRRILSLFDKSCYVGYTATPFANIFIDPDAHDKKVQDELFPRDFIYALEAPSSYFGAERLFLDENTSNSIIRKINDCENFIPLAAKTGDTITDLPPSLYRALDQFIVARAIRNLRGHSGRHCSMMINVSRLVNMQRTVRDLVRLRMDKIHKAVTYNYRMPEEKSEKNIYMQDLKQAYDDEYSQSGHSWQDVKEALNGVFEHFQVCAINNSSPDTLDFKRYEADDVGLTAIAIGGLSLSRGLTIEGLTVSYMYRNTKMYDTLMQMGRWFGYRTDFEDLCRVYLSQDSINWYTHIAESAGELIEQIYRMQREGKSPKDFGLFIKRHPDSLLITAPNKMRNGTNIDLRTSLSGCLRETYILSTDRAVNDANFALIEAFWKRKFDGIEEETKKGLIFRNVPVAILKEFLTKFKTPGWAANRDLVIDYLDAITPAYPEADILLISPRGGPGEDRPHELRQQRRKVGDGQPQGGLWHLNKDRVASRGDEALGLSEAQLAQATAEAKADKGNPKEPSDTHFRAVRNKPLLMIHNLQPSDTTEIPSKVAAFGISFPFSKHGEDISVMANKVWIKENQPDADNPKAQDDIDE